MPLRIEDYALIGDCHTAALVGKDGSIDWLCLPRFVSGACFAALLGTPDHGRWLIAPQSEPRRVTRRYRQDTLILETEFETDEGTVTLIDCMPPRMHDPSVVRVVVGQRGSVPMKMQLVIRFDYGSIIPWVRRTKTGIRAIAGPDSLQLCTPLEMRGENMTTVAEFTINEGERIPLVLQWQPSNEEPSCVAQADETINKTDEWWRAWAGRSTYDGPYREQVVRSLITLKAQTFAPTGGL